MTLTKLLEKTRKDYRETNDVAVRRMLKSFGKALKSKIDIEEKKKSAR